MSIPAIVLAAGASRRLGRPKQLLEFEGQTLLARTIRIAYEGGADPLFAILGANAETIGKSVDLGNVVTVLNLQWEEGIASSIRAGLRALLSCVPDALGAAILVCDQPRVTSSYVRKLTEIFESESGSSIVASIYAGTRGIPAVFPRVLFPQLLRLEGDKGARGILSDPANLVLELPLTGGEVDLDSPSDLDQLA